MKIIILVLFLAVLISGCVDRTTLDVSVHSSDDYTSQHTTSGVSVSDGVAKVDINTTVEPRKLFVSHLPTTDINLSCFQNDFDDNPVTIKYYGIYERESNIIKDSSGIYYIPRLYIQGDYNYSVLKAFAQYRCYVRSSSIMELKTQVYYDGILTLNKTMYIDSFDGCRSVSFSRQDYSDRQLENIYSDSDFGKDCNTIYKDRFTLGLQIEDKILNEAKKL